MRCIHLEVTSGKKKMNCMLAMDAGGSKPERNIVIGSIAEIYQEFAFTLSFNSFKICHINERG